MLLRPEERRDVNLLPLKLDRSNSFSKQLRLLKSKDFKFERNHLKRFHGRCLSFYYVKNSLDHPRIGFSVSRKAGNAPMRNRIRRLLREMFRINQQSIENFDINVTFNSRFNKDGSDLDISSIVREDFEKLLSKILKENNGR